MARSNQENTTWIAGQNMASDFFSSPVVCRDTAHAQGTIQFRWAGVAGSGTVKLQTCHLDAWGWSNMGGANVEFVISSAAGTSCFLLDVMGVVQLRLFFDHGTVSAGTFDASYFLKGA